MTQTVCTRELLGGEIFRLARQMKKLGVDEMRIMEPLPCGSLADHPEAVLTAAEQRRLRRIHELLNTDPRFPKASVFPYFESERQFGCGAGVQHSYVDNKGNFGPCDFLDCTFGNLLEEDPRRIWRRMTRAVDGPHCACLAKHPGARRASARFLPPGCEERPDAAGSNAGAQLALLYPGPADPRPPILLLAWG